MNGHFDGFSACAALIYETYRDFDDAILLCTEDGVANPVDDPIAGIADCKKCTLSLANAALTCT